MAVIDLSFVLVGTTIPLDHGYALFSALSRIMPELHGGRRVGVHPIRGRQAAPRPIPRRRSALRRGPGPWPGRMGDRDGRSRHAAGRTSILCPLYRESSRSVHCGDRAVGGHCMRSFIPADRILPRRRPQS
jgi:Cas6 Crispr